MNLLFEKSAVEYCLKNLKKKGYKWNKVDELNQGRYTIVQGSPNIAIILKKAWFMNFGEMGFRNHITDMEETGIGDSLNVEDLKIMVQNSIQDLYIVYKEGHIYTIPLHEFLIQSHKWENKEGKEVRSISIHLYKRWNVEFGQKSQEAFNI